MEALFLVVRVCFFLNDLNARLYFVLVREEEELLAERFGMLGKWCLNGVVGLRN